MLAVAGTTYGRSQTIRMEHRRQQVGDHSESHEGEPTLDTARDYRSRESVGTLLRRTRESYRLALREAADQLRIRAAYLDAIERSDFDALPGPTYAVGFVRSYAVFLGLDEEQIVRRFKEEVEGIDRAQQLHFPEPVNEGKVPGGAILLVSLVMIALAYGGWYAMTSNGRSMSDLVPAVPERLRALLGDEAPPDDGSGSVADEAGTVVAEAGSADETESAAGTDAAGTAATGAPSDAGVDASGEPESARTSGDAAGNDGAARSNASDGRDTASGSETAGTRSSGPDDSRGAAAADSEDAEPPAVPEPPTQADTGTVARTSPSTSSGMEAEPASPAAEGDAGAEASSPSPDASEDSGAASDRAASDDGTATAAEAAEPDADAAPTSSAGAADDSDAPPAIPRSTRADTGDGGGGAGDAQTAAARTAGRVFGAASASSRITLRAREDSWVQVRGPEDSLLLTRVLHAGDVYRVPDRDGLVLHTGNAGGLEVTVDGERAGPLGASGEVRRNIQLVPGRLRR